ncbi:hypothetical protein VA249_01140 [Vibrio alfacsensis]|uniref:hypothetical protein n=1 Tax=Vibrio alfacsensis TaxID=1074311 RepID=UPI001BED837C|nr:hypothetical protein [Vibrio alfacsensis]BBM63468.1 hypothetical protein VA249_01140 [Vibrio alfacsensis]
MKRFVFFALLSANISAAAGTDHLYIGGNLLVGHNTELDAGFASIDESNDLGAGVFGGYSFAVHPNVDLGVELEYQHFGEAEFAENVSVEGNAFYINARPKFMDKGNNLYSALILGVGTLQGETNILGHQSQILSFLIKRAWRLAICLMILMFPLAIDTELLSLMA